MFFSAERFQTRFQSKEMQNDFYTYIMWKGNDQSITVLKYNFELFEFKTNY